MKKIAGSEGKLAHLPTCSKTELLHIIWKGDLGPIKLIGDQFINP